MSERAEQLASTFEAANNGLIAAVEGCSDEQLRATCPDEGWSVAVAAHHVAASHGPLSQLVGLIASGQELPPITMEMINAGNAQHAVDFANVSRDEVLKTLKTEGATVASLIRSLSDEQLNRTAAMPFAGGAAWSAADVIERIIIGHPQQHTQSIKAAVGG
ncbi:MAG: DinB family protein [Chloroflexota bacterium]